MRLREYHEARSRVCWLSVHVRRYDTAPPRKAPAELAHTAVSAATVLATSARAPQIPASSASSPQQLKRILRELKRYQRDPHTAIEVYPVEANIAFWRLLLPGPEGTPYEGGTFLLYVSFPLEYPTLAPEVRC